jgi:Tol biopolymer transport system component
VVRLTADTVMGIARDTLRSRTREGGPHLFWATQPLWSPDGASIAYVTNRGWMLRREGGQEVWLADVRSGRERPLLSEPGEFFAPSGWLGPELVYTSRAGGISAVNVRTGARRAIARGSAVAFSPRGSRLLYMTSAGDTVRAHVLTGRGAVDVPDPPPGERLEYAGAFSPDGDRLVLGTSFARDSGMTRALYLFALGEQRLTKLSEWSFRDGSRHPLGLPAWLDDSTLLLTRFDRGTGLESSALVRLPPR